MAPSTITVQTASDIQICKKPTAYLLDKYHPTAVARAKELFNLVVPSDPEHKNWKQAQYLIVRGSRLTADDISACPNLLAIGKQCVGTDKIDAAACSDRNIKILNTPSINARAVAELVLTLTTAVARGVRPLCLRMAAGEAVKKETCDGLILHKSTVGIIGMGNIGKIVAQTFRDAFDSNVIAFDPLIAESACADLKHKRAKSVDDLVRESDNVTVHVPLTAETKGLISYRGMSLMKRQAIIINAARGGIVNEQDLCQALDEGLLWGAGLDCHEKEPPTDEKYESLWKHPNVVSLPHVGAATAQTQRETATAAVERLFEYIKSRETKI